MKVKLIGVTQPVGIEDIDTAEELIAYCARVSNPSNQNNKATADRLVRYLLKEKHWSPLEMVSVVIEVQTTRDIARQILRHRSFSFQEFSQRYSIAQDFETREARRQDVSNRQNSIELSDYEDETSRWWAAAQLDIQEHVQDVYSTALDLGIAKEQARAVLPEGMTVSRLYMAGTLRSWVHYCHLRMGNGTQAEHMEVARACWNVLGQEFPNVIAACEDVASLG